MAKNLLSPGGYTIVELIATIVAFGFVAIGVVSLFLTIQNIQMRVANLESASRAANRQVEALRNDNYNQLIAGQTIDFSSQIPTTLPAPRSGQAVITEPTPGIKRVDVTVSYTENHKTKKVKLTSDIGIIGISQ